MVESKDLILQEAWERRPIVEVVAEHVELRELESGLFEGLCPFHADKSPSFIVMPKVDRCKCWTCWQAGGDAIDFIQKLKKCSFQEALPFATTALSVTDSMLALISSMASKRQESMMAADFRKILMSMRKIESDAGTQQALAFYNETLKCRSSDEVDELLDMWTHGQSGWSRRRR